MFGISFIVALFLATGGAGAADATRAAFSYAKAHPSVRSAAQRQLVIDRASSSAALKAAFPGDSAPFRGVLQEMSASDGTFATLATCTPRPRRRCELPDDVLFMHVMSAERQSPSRIVIRIGIAFQAGESALSSQTMTLRLDRLKGGWQVTRFISGSVG